VGCLAGQRFFGFVLFTPGFANHLFLCCILFVLAVICPILAVVFLFFLFLFLFIFFLGFQDNEFVMDKLVQATRRERTPCSVDKAVNTISDAMSAKRDFGALSLM
jgi:hypothetical protein